MKTLIYDKETRQMVAYCIDGVWVLPASWDVVTSEEEIPTIDTDDGDVYYVDNLVSN